MVPVVLRCGNTEKSIIRKFCMGATPSEIDRKMGLAPGTARHTVSSWWLDDNVLRSGGMESVLGVKKWQ